MASSASLSLEVARALAERKGVVALESTLIAQGLPWPENLETARAAEAAVRSAGAVPATVAVFAGTIQIGLSDDQLALVARSETFWKASRRDLSAAVARGENAATTVSATLWVARRHGIGVMATGGLGGVHRGAAITFDVSTDLDELARADGLLLVCSGFKSILDLPATLDSLETRGVPIVGYRTSELPAFTTFSSGLLLDRRVDCVREAAELVKAHRALELPGAVVLAQPVPASVALDREEMETALAAALREANNQGVAGKAVTPFLLDHIRRGTEGRSLEANRALIIANARLAGEAAMAIAD